MATRDSDWTRARSFRWGALLGLLAAVGCEAPDDTRAETFEDAPAHEQTSEDDLTSAAVSGGGGHDAATHESTAAPVRSAAASVTYHKDIRPIVSASCLDCHQKGGVGPFPLEDWASVQPVAASVVHAVSEGHMPPSPFNNACQTVKDDRSLTPAQRALFTSWQTAGYPEGNPADYVAPPPRARQELGTPSVVMVPDQKYTPPRNADEYRCFVLQTLPKESFVTAMQITPSAPQEVHHVILYRVAQAQLTQLRNLDSRDPKPGYACAGGPGVAGQNMFSNRPGADIVAFDHGDAAFMEAGSTLVVQVHYNTKFLPQGQAPVPEGTKVSLWTLPEGKLPDRVIYRTTTFGPVNIPAGNPHVVSNISRSMRQLSVVGGGLFGGTFVPGEIIGMTPHAHQLATKMNASLKRAGGTNVCLDDVRWDFHWQLDYLFTKGVPYTANDQFVASCTYDNSAANQPVVDGKKQTPRNVIFGERTTDEMCEHYIWLRFDRAAFQAARGR